MHRLLVLASVLSHNSKYVADDFFPNIRRNSIKNLLDFIYKQQERTSRGLLTGGRGKFHKVLLFKSCFLPPDFTPLERHRAFCTMLNISIYLHVSK